MNIQSQVVSMDNLFQLAGINYKELKENTGVNIEEKNIRIKSFNHSSNQSEFKIISKLIRKKDSEMYRISSKAFSFMATPEHRVYTKEFGYIELKDVKENCHILLDTDEFSELTLEKLKGVYPVLDMQVEGNENYFSNNILSHNSPDKIGVGESMKFFASVRIKVTKSDIVKTDEEGQEQINITASIFKNKVAPPYKKATFTLLTGKDGFYGIDTYREILKFAVDFGIIKKGGAWYRFEVDGVEQSFQGEAKVVSWFRENEKEFGEIKTAVIEKLAQVNSAQIVPVENSFDAIKEQSEETKKVIKQERKPREAKVVEEVVEADIAEEVIEEVKK